MDHESRPSSSTHETPSSSSTPRAVIVTLCAVLFTAAVFAVASNQPTTQMDTKENDPGTALAWQDTSSIGSRYPQPPLPAWAMDMKLGGKYPSLSGGGIDYFTFERRGQCGCTQTEGYCKDTAKMPQSDLADSILQCFELCESNPDCGYFSYSTERTHGNFAAPHGKKCDLYTESGGCSNPAKIPSLNYGAHSTSYKMQRSTCADKQPPAKWKINTCADQKEAGMCQDPKFADNQQGFCRKTCDLCGSAKKETCLDAAANVCAYWVSSLNGKICSQDSQDIAFMNSYMGGYVNLKDYCCQSCEAYLKYPDPSELLGWQYEGFASLKQCEFTYSLVYDRPADDCCYNLVTKAAYESHTKGRTVTAQELLDKYYNELLPSYTPERAAEIAKRCADREWAGAPTEYTVAGQSGLCQRDTYENSTPPPTLAPPPCPKN